MSDREFEYALFQIKDFSKFKEFMKTHLKMLEDNEQYGFRVVTLGCGKEPFEWEGYINYLESVGAVDTYHQFHLGLDEWIKMGRPKDESEELADRIDEELT